MERIISPDLKSNEMVEHKNQSDTKPTPINFMWHQNKNLGKRDNQLYVSESSKTCNVFKFDSWLAWSLTGVILRWVVSLLVSENP